LYSVKRSTTSSPWQKPAELNSDKYLKSHAQVLLDRTGAPENLWFLEKGLLSKVRYNGMHKHTIPFYKRERPIRVRINPPWQHL
jgi:hypothetical protein